MVVSVLVGPFHIPPLLYCMSVLNGIVSIIHCVLSFFFLKSYFQASSQFGSLWWKTIFVSEKTLSGPSNFWGITAALHVGEWWWCSGRVNVTFCAYSTDTNLAIPQCVRWARKMGLGLNMRLKQEGRRTITRGTHASWNESAHHLQITF